MHRACSAIALRRAPTEPTGTATAQSRPAFKIKASFAARLAALLVSHVLACAAHAQSAPLAAYSFDSSSGTTLSDVSGQNNTVTLLNGPTWSAGKYGNALSFDGSNDAGVASSANPTLNLVGRSFTLSAWVNARSNSSWQMIVNKPFGSGHSAPYFDWSMHRETSTGRLVAFLGCEGVQRTSNAAIPLNTWTHVAVTYDGASLRHYINGALDRTTSVTCSISNTNSRPIRIGANGAGAEVMNGLIDDVRIYNRPLSGTEIQADMGSALGGGGSAPDASAPTVSVTAPASGASVNGTVTVSANAADNVGVVGVQFKLDGAAVGSEDSSAPYALSWNTTQAANGNHSLTATARDAAGNGKTSSAVTVNVNNTSSSPPPPPATAPIAAYSLDASSGSTLVDVSGHSNTITLLNAPTWRVGKYGNALSFDGSNDAGVANSANAALNLLGRSLTLSAWVNPRSRSGWQMIVNKPYISGHSAPYFDWSMHLETSTGRLIAFLGCEGVQRASNSSIPLNTWTHVAVTYDGSSLRHYINGVLDRTTGVSCAVTNTNSRPIRIGANGAGVEVMNGLIDEVRIYNRPLSAAEIGTDLGMPLGGGTTPPPADPPPTLSLSASPTAVPSGGSSNLAWSSTEASSCIASGAWSGSKPVAGTASTGALDDPNNVFTLQCTGGGGTAVKSATVTAEQPQSTKSGLDFPGAAATTGTIRFRFTNPLAQYPATYIWRVYPRSQPHYYTTFFWGNDGEFWWDNGNPNSYYGAHPYPSPSPNQVPAQDVGPRFWEVSVDGLDVLSPTTVEYNRWHTQALRVWSDSSGKHHEFYWDLPDTSKVIRYTASVNYANSPPPSPALTFGDAPWNPSNEILYGILRGIQVYRSSLSLQDILTESEQPLSTAPGASNIWYMNLNPTPTDISDKSGAGHNPSWVGSLRPQLWRE